MSRPRRRDPAAPFPTPPGYEGTDAGLVARDFTNLCEYFGMDAVLVWLRRYAPKGRWRHVPDRDRGRLEVSIETMATVLHGVALELGFGDGGDARGHPS